jgi:Leucine-rich repeat (LRR) protein
MDMNESITALFDELKAKITREHLQTISVEIIRLYKEKNSHQLSQFALRIGINDTHSINRVFASLIQTYHPDKCAKIEKELDASRGNIEELLRLKNTYIFTIVKAAQDYAPPEKEESYSYDDTDFGYQEYRRNEEYDYDAETGDDTTDERVFERERNFTEAVNDHFFGGLDETVTVIDLKNLDGELELSDYGISSLKGIEYCVHLASLDLSSNNILKIDRLANLINLEYLFLSDNCIESIKVLSEMKELKELDISHNMVEDLSPLLSLDKLIYVNIMNNPVKDKTVITLLNDRGVMIIE